jgi:hypothetical protein
MRSGMRIERVLELAPGANAIRLDRDGAGGSTPGEATVRVRASVLDRGFAPFVARSSRSSGTSG